MRFFASWGHRSNYVFLRGFNAFISCNFFKNFFVYCVRFCLTENKYDSYKDGHLIGLSFNANDDNEFVYGDDESPPIDDDDLPPRGTAGAPRYHDVDSADG